MRIAIRTKALLKGVPAVFFAHVILTGCATMKPSVPRDLDPAKFWKEQLTKRDALHSISGKLSVLVKSSEISARGRGAIASRIVGNRAMRLELRDPLGKIQYLAVLNGEGFSAFVLGQSLEVRDRTAGRSYLKKSMGMDLSFLEVQELALGLIPGARSEAGWSWERPRAPMPRLSRGPDQWVDVDPDLNEVREARWKDVQVSYSDFRPCCTARHGMSDPNPMVLARQVKLTSLTRPGKLEFEWVEVNPGDIKDMTFASPNVKGFKREDLK